MKILIADDHPTNLKLLRAQLEAEGMTVFEAGDGMEALAVLEREPVDAIISDVLMPKMDGYQFCYALHQSERFQAIPCILYSNTFASDSSQHLALGFGADLFLKKPAPAERILAALHEVMRKDSRHTRETAAASAVQHLKETQPYSEHLIRELEWQNTELEELKNQLLEVNHKLLIRTKKLEQLEAELRKTNDELECRVRARTAELEAANKELEAFSYSISHDLRAPLRSISGYAGMVVRDCQALLPPKSQQHLQTVIAESAHMNQLVEDLLKLSRFNRQPLTKRSVTMARLVEEVVQELRTEPGGAPVEAKVGLLPICQADPVLLKQVLVNLLSNAFKFTRGKEPRLVEVGSQIAPGETVYFVRDNGAGFDMKYAEKLFGVFQRMHRQEEFEGTGIGLSIVQRIVHRHGGRIWAEAKVGEGATFFFTLESAVVAPSM